MECLGLKTICTKNTAPRKYVLLDGSSVSRKLWAASQWPGVDAITVWQRIAGISKNDIDANKGITDQEMKMGSHKNRIKMWYQFNRCNVYISKVQFGHKLIVAFLQARQLQTGEDSVWWEGWQGGVFPHVTIMIINMTIMIIIIN